MTYDVAFRHRQALDPAGLSTTAGALHALCAAISDCRNVGKDIESDPAVMLLARHLGSVATDGKPAASDLRRACITEIGEIERNPLLLPLARRGVSHDEAAKRSYHAEGRRVLKRLADALQLESAAYDIRSCLGGPAVAGEIILHSAELYVMIGIDWPDERRHVLFRRVTGRDDYTGGTNHWASIKEVLACERFAERLTRELQLTPPAFAPARLFA